MAIAMTVQRYLSDRDIEYDTLTHAPTDSSMATAESSHVNGASIAKGVLLKTEDGYLLAVLPATHHIRFGELTKCLDEPAELASEAEVASLFSDCDPGAVPALGAAYGIAVIVDDSLADLPDLYIEGGDHATLVHLTAPAFHRLLGDAPHGRFSDPV